MMIKIRLRKERGIEFVSNIDKLCVRPKYSTKEAFALSARQRVSGNSCGDGLSHKFLKNLGNRVIQVLWNKLSLSGLCGESCTNRAKYY
jgi:hypothetical protein